MSTNRSAHPRSGRRLPATGNRVRRHLVGFGAVALAFTLLPIPSLTPSVAAQSPSSAVTGLARGASGDAVRDVQEALRDEGLVSASDVDGIYGPGTEAAVKRLQARNGLNQTGRVDMATAIALGLERSALFGLAGGDEGARVELLQQKLIGAGNVPSGGADGIFGPGTTEAVKAFQRSKGFLPTGTVNAATAAALKPVPAATGSAATAEAAATSDSAASSNSGSDSNSTGSSSADMVGLKIGSNGAGVERVQRTLMGLGFTVVGGADGVYGVLTANAVRSFQNANGIEITGAVNRATGKILERFDDGSPSDSADGEHDPTATSPYVGLQYGSLGSDVESLQQALIDAGITVRGGADGIFGELTLAALKRFQSQHGLSQSGKVDEATANALSSGSSGGSTTGGLVGLKAGSLGNTVQQLQQALIDAGVTLRGGADGIFGPMTAEALRNFQTSQGLESTGVVNAATARALANPQAPDTSASSGSNVGYPSYGERGSRVLALQRALVQSGVPVGGGVDGDFGAKTAAAVMEFQRRNDLNVTGKVNDATAAALGLSAAAAPAAPDPSSVQMAHFPVEAPCGYADTFGYTRGAGRIHLGVDIIGAKGQEIYATVDGKIGKVYKNYPGSLAGNGVRVTQPDGTYYFYAHLDSLADGIELGVPVKAGQVIGHLGSTGNSGTPHLHLEIHPKGGAAVNPYPLVKAIDAC